MGEEALTVEDSLLFAYANYKLKNFKMMLNYTQSALKMRPDSAMALHYKALALRGLGDLKGAEKAVKEAISRDSNNYSHVFLLGIIYWNSGEMSFAEENLKKAINYSPNEAIYLVEYATFLIHQGRFEEALDAAYKAKSLDNNAEKLKEVINSARQKEFDEEIDVLTYEPPLPFSPETAIPYLRLGDYYIQYSFLSNAQIQFSKALHYDTKNERAMKGFATATRLKEGGFYTFAHNFAIFFLQWYILLSIGVILALLGLVAFMEPFFRMPAAGIAGGIVLLIVLILILGLRQRSVGDYQKILKQWGVESADEMIKKMVETQMKSRKQLEEEAVLNRSKDMLNYAGLFSILAVISLVAQMIVVNLDVRMMDIAIQDNVAVVKLVLLFVIIVCMSLAIYFRYRSRAILEESAVKGEEATPAPEKKT